MWIDEGLQPGIYFDLPAEQYHADKAISRGDMVNLLDTPNTYWKASWMNAERKRKAGSNDQEYGEAFHYLLFEPHEFERRYQVVPIDAWDITKQKIQAEDYYAMVESIKVLRAGKDSNLFLSGGVPEVTIVFDYQGMRYRTRHDYLMPLATSDFKTAFTLHIGHLKNTFSRWGYDIQLALYKKSRVELRQALINGTADIYGTPPEGFMQKFMASQMDEFIFLFQRKSLPYPYLPLMPEDDTEDEGLRRWREAIIIYQKNRKLYGTKPWPVCDGKVKPFSMFFGIREEN